ncbi:MAG: hypothetical protein KDA60_08145 [Planctomycetales bacterium]|nr:hypothetical protein [Planctomycetales bacterium]
MVERPRCSVISRMIVVASLAVGTVPVRAQGFSPATDENAPLRWRAAGGHSPVPGDGQAIASSGGHVRPVANFATDRPDFQLPNHQGQVWREYDIRAYTQNAPNEDKPEQAIVDWILRETGTEMWFSEPIGMLNASRGKLLVYHTPEVQRLVHDIVARFVAGQSVQHVFGVRLVTLVNPNWRTGVYANLQPVDVQTPGVQAWLISREHAAVLLDALRQRTDYREHNTPNLVIRSGQTHEISRTRPLAYVRGLLPRNVPTVGGYDLDMGQVEEGFTMKLSPLVSADGKYVDSVVRLETSHIEKLSPVWVESPVAGPSRQTTQIQVPQMLTWRLHERFRWPTDQVLLISCGIVANPGPERKAGTGLGGGLFAGPSRAEALLMLEAKGRAPDPLAVKESSVRTGAINYRGRY